MVIPIWKPKKFPFGDSPFPNRVCAHLGINILALATVTVTATATAMATDRRMFQVYNNLARFSSYLASFLACAHLEVFQKERKNGPSIRATNTNTQINI